MKHVKLFEEFLGAEDSLVNETEAVVRSKIGTYFSVKGDEFNFGYRYGKYEGENFENLKDIASVNSSKVDSYIKELNKAYALLKTKDKKNIKNFLNGIDDGLFGAETYNGWMYMDDIDNEPHASSDDPEFSAMYNTLLYVIAKIEAFLAYRGKMTYRS